MSVASTTCFTKPEKYYPNSPFQRLITSLTLS
jgi:hypothetical protein